MNELIVLTAAEAAQKLAAGEISAVELTRAHIDRIEQPMAPHSVRTALTVKAV